MNEDVKAYIVVLKEYIDLLHDEISGLVGIAHVHGWRSSQERIKLGAQIRDRIAALEKKLGIISSNEN
jgi:hypothetical protein